jgi:hypothetical protein
MKTSKSSNPQMKNIIIGLSLSCALTLLMTSCQKEESAQPAADSNYYNDQKQLNITGETFEFLMMDHYSGNSCKIKRN